MKKSQELSSAKRNPALDIIRIFALFTVVSVHAFLNSNYYKATMSGAAMFFATYVRMFLMICVPLFIILTGYLMCHKQLGRKYYFKITKTLTIYLLASIACLVFKGIFLGESLSIGRIAKDILNFTAAPYAWYVEMYIGLFLIAPFLNLVFYGLKTKRQRLTLIATCVFLTILPQSLKYLPNWWIGAYPISYYFVGCYLREHKTSFSAPTKMAIILIATLLGAIRVFASFYGKHFEWAGWNGHSSTAVFVASAMTFALLSDFKYQRLSERTSRLLARISGLVLGAYLCSWIMDEIVWKNLTLLNIQTTPRVLLGILLVYCGSILLSVILNIIYWLLARLARYIHNALLAVTSSRSS